MVCGYNPLGYDINRVAAWSPSKIYFATEYARFDDAIWQATTAPRFSQNINKSPMRGQFWTPMPAENCHNPAACILTPAASTVPSVQTVQTVPTVVEPATAAPNNAVFPVSPVGPTTTLTPVIPIDPVPPISFVDMLPELPSLPSMQDLLELAPDLQNLPEIETKHIIIGVASVLTFILLFK